MYRCVEKLRSWTFPLLMAAMLSACGGAPADSESQPSSANNKPTPDSSSSIAVSSEQSSIATSLPTSSSSSSAALSASSASRSSTETYTRVSLPSSSSASSTPEGINGSIPAPQLRLYRLSETSITITWEHAIGDIRIRSYNIYRNDQLLATIDYPMTTYADNNLSPGSLHTYTIIAADIDGNVSPVAAPLTIKTLSPFNGFSSSASSVTSISSANSVASSRSSHSAISSTSSKNTSSASSIARSSSPSQQGLQISWSHPTKRENGTFLELDEIAGYEIRFKQSLTSNYTYLILNGNRTTSYLTDLIPANSIIEIAVYDKNGLFSDFVAISPHQL